MRAFTTNLRCYLAVGATLQLPCGDGIIISCELAGTSGIDEQGHSFPYYNAAVEVPDNVGEAWFAHQHPHFTRDTAEPVAVSKPPPYLDPIIRLKTVANNLRSMGDAYTAASAAQDILADTVGRVGINVGATQPKSQAAFRSTGVVQKELANFFLEMAERIEDALDAELPPLGIAGHKFELVGESDPATYCLVVEKSTSPGGVIIQAFWPEHGPGRPFEVPLEALHCGRPHVAWGRIVSVAVHNVPSANFGLDDRRWTVDRVEPAPTASGRLHLYLREVPPEDKCPQR